MNRIARSADNADSHIGMNGGDLPNGTREAGESNKQHASDGSGHHRIPQNVGNSAITIENTPHDIDYLIIRQLEEDLDSYRYDVDFCKTQLHPDNVATITPAEARTFQLRLLDLGHQMRSIHHRIQLMQAGINNSYYSGGHTGWAGATTANSYYGSYPAMAGPQQGHGSYSTGGPSTPYDARQGRSLQPSSAYSAYHEGPQERRGPGRPLGSKNRSRPPPDAAQAAAAGNTGSAKAAALASAGAKRTLPSEISVANDDAPAESGAGASSKPTKSAKRPRTDAGADSQTTTNAEGQTEDAPTRSASVAHSEDRNSDISGMTTEANGTPGLVGEATNNKNSSSGDHLHAHKGGLQSTPNVARPLEDVFLSESKATLPSPAPSGPRGKAYTRLGHWMCTLCTTQKYLKHPSPKQPAEPSSWALRDISKIVTHFMRMHGEHTDAERCQELGNALGYNSGPFKYWVEVTKKTQVTDEQIQQAITDLRDGKLPELLRKLSAAAAQFPRRD